MHKLIKREVIMFKILFPLFVLMFATSVFAQAKKSPKATEAKAEMTKEEKDEADQLITNRRMRAAEGSLSPWSVSTFFNYSGGSLADPSNPERPNIVGGGAVQTLQALSGTVGVRYRVSKRDSLTLNTGFFMTTPFHESDDRIKNPGLRQRFNETKRQLNISDPSLRYSHLTSIAGIQTVIGWTSTLITNNQLNDIGFRSAHTPSINMLKDVGNSGFSFGALIQGTIYDFNDKLGASGNFLTDKGAGFYPQAEYVINDTFNLRTIYGWQVYENLRGQKGDTWQKRKVYQSVGLGISVTRDIFLYPNIQFIPSNIRSDVTNIAMSANINLF